MISKTIRELSHIVNLRECHVQPPSGSLEWVASERSDAAVAPVLESVRLCKALDDCPHYHNWYAAADSRLRPTAVVSAAAGQVGATQEAVGVLAV
jgi:hypothetical protein